MTCAVWGVTFKPETDDLRQAPALTLIDQLLEAGVGIRAHDPAGERPFRRVRGSTLI